MGINCSCGVRFWSRWTAASCQRGVSQRVRDRGGRGQLQSSLGSSWALDLDESEMSQSHAAGGNETLGFHPNRLNHRLHSQKLQLSFLWHNNDQYLCVCS